MIEKVCLAEKFALFHETWSPKIVGELNDSYSPPATQNLCELRSKVAR